MKVTKLTLKIGDKEYYVAWTGHTTKKILRIATQELEEVI